MIDYDLKCIFVHCQKCAGESIEQAIFGRVDKGYGGDPFAGSPDKHLSSAQYIEKYGSDIWQDFYTFSIVRNPWDRVISWIRYRDKRLNRSEKITPRKIRQELKVPYLIKNTYDKLLFADDGTLLVDYVGKFENLDSDFSQIAGQLDLNLPGLPHINSTKHAPYWEYYDRAAIDLVYRLYRKDIEYFGYSFEG